MSGPRDDRRRRLLRLLVGLYPRSFRRRYGHGMIELGLRRLRRSAGGDAGRATLTAWAKVALDLIGGAALERLGAGTKLRPKERRTTTRTGREGGTMMDGMGQDLGHAVRRIARAPIFSMAAVAIVALGIGANTAVFTVVDAVVLRPPPYAEPERVVRIYQDSDDGEPSSSSFPAYRDMAAFGDIFQAVSASTPATLTWEAPGGPRTAVVEFATSSHMDVLGLRPALGRWFQPAQDQPGAGYYALVNHATWRAEMGADPGVIGRTVRLEGRPVTIIGVGPEAFNGIGGALVTDFWPSISSVEVGGAFRVANLDRRQDHWYDVHARLAPGVAVPQARSAMDALAARLAEEYPELNRGRDITVFRAADVRIHPEVDRALLPVGGVALAIAGVVLLLACSNLASLLLARSIARNAEVAVRRALGAGRSRVARLFLTEALVLSVAGGLLGVLLARWALTFSDRLAVLNPMAAHVDLAMETDVLLFAATLILGSAAFFGVVPALRATRSDLAADLRDESRSSSKGRGTSMLQGGLVAVQVAASVVLLVAAVLLGRSLTEIQSVDPGFRVDGVAYLRTNTGVPGLEDADGAVLMERLREAVAALPGVTGAALTSRPPLGLGGSTTTVIEGYRSPAGTDAVELDYAVVGEEYFEVMDIPLVEGRLFGPDDGPDGEPVVIVNETAARRFWDGDALGGRRRPQGVPDGWSRVVGVVADHKVESLDEPPTPMQYFPAGRNPLQAGYVVAHTDADAATLLAPMRAALDRVSPSLPLADLGTMESRMGNALFVPRLTAGLLGAFALLALLLAGLGVYAVVSFSVARRTAEMGIRLALGADRSRLVRMVVLKALGMVVLGLISGLAVAFVGAPLLERFLFGVPALDAASFAGTAAALTLLGALAAWVPARRAARADPVESLRKA